MSESLKQIRQVSRWRAQFNALRGFNIQRAVSLIEAGERGAYAELQLTYRLIEKRYPTLTALKTRRLAAIGKLDWNIKTCADEELPPGATKAMADAQAKYLRERYDAIDNLHQAIRFIALATFRGYAHLEKQVVGGDSPKQPKSAAEINHLELVEQWFWCREGMYGAWQYNAEASFGKTKGDEVDLANFILREVEDPINEIAIVSFPRNGLAEKDWDAFVEIYGVPGKTVIGPPNIPAGKEEEYQAAAEKIAGGQSGYLPFGSTVEPDEGTRGVQPFEARLDHLDEKLVLVGTGGKLTMLNDATGIGGGASEQHEDVFQDIAINEAREINEPFQKQFDRPALNEKFPGQPILAYFEIAATEETDVGEVVTQVNTLSQAGLQVDPGQVEEKTGYKVTATPSIPPVDQPPVGTATVKNRLRRIVAALFNRDPLSQAGQVDQELLDNSIDLAARGLAADFAPLRSRLQHIRQIDDFEQKLNALRQLRRDLPSMLPRDPQLAAAYEQQLTAALFNGIAEGAAQRRGK